MTYTRLLSMRVGIVTGAGSGIGAAVARQLAHDGARLLLADRDEWAVRGIAAELGDLAEPFHCDVTDSAAVSAMVARCVAHFGRLDFAVNNAGISQPPARIDTLTEDVWSQVINVNLNSVFLCIKAQIPAMRATGGGVIINMASALGLIGWQAGASSYVAAKHGVVGLTKAAALEYAEDNIRVVAIAPGLIETPLIRSPDAAARLTAFHPLGRLGKAEDVANLVAFLASDRAAFITGSVHSVDGGWTAT